MVIMNRQRLWIIPMIEINLKYMVLAELPVETPSTRFRICVSICITLKKHESAKQLVG